MEMAEIIERLAPSGPGPLPVEAIRAARDRKAEAVPAFVELIEALIAGNDAAREASPVFLAFHLLGEWRAHAAYRPLTRLLRCDPDRVDAWLGDAVTETSKRVMAAVCDGDPQPLFDVVLDRHAGEFIRAAMCEALAIAVLAGTLERDQVARFLRDCFANLRPQATNYVWSGWLDAIAALGLDELSGLVKKACDRRYVDPWWCRYETFTTLLKRADDSPDPADYTPFGDTVAELSTWAAFAARDEEEDDPAEPLWPADGALGEPAHNPYRHVGRNDPCPCGSGKKFKRCCLA